MQELTRIVPKAVLYTSPSLLSILVLMTSNGKQSRVAVNPAKDVALPFGSTFNSLMVCCGA